MATTDPIVADIADARRAMDRDLRALQARLKYEVNPRVQARKHPLVLAGIVAGVALTALLVVKILRS